MKFVSKFKNPVLLLLIGIFLIASFMRFYRIREYLTFLGDEGRDVLVVKRMLIDGKFTLLGPITSVGSIYMGPVYYYLTAPFLYLWNFDPVGPAVMVALFSLLTIYLIYRIGSDYFHTSVGLIAAITYSVARLTIVYGRSSWNPNVVPFFAVLLIYSILKVLVNKKYKYLTVIGFCLGALIQLHYVTFMFFLILATVYLWYRPKISIKYILYGFLSFLLAYSPFILFELRHGFVNTQGAVKFMLENNSPKNEMLPQRFLITIQDVFIRLFWRPLIALNAEITKLFIVSFIVVFFRDINKIIGKKESKIGFTVLLIWLVVGVLSFGLYRGAIYDYYLGSLFAVPHLIFGLLFYLLWKKGFASKAFAVTLLLLITVFNIILSPFAIEPNNMLKNTEMVSDFVAGKTSGKPYNFALIATHNSDHAYRYFLELKGNPPVVIENEAVDPERKTTASQLLVVCEEKICQPLGHPLWEIAGFGPAEIVGEWKVSTVKVFRLVPVGETKN